MPTPISEELRSEFEKRFPIHSSVSIQTFEKGKLTKKNLISKTIQSTDEKLLLFIAEREEKVYQKGLEKGALKGERNRIISQLKEEERESWRTAVLYNCEPEAAERILEAVRVLTPTSNQEEK